MIDISLIGIAALGTLLVIVVSIYPVVKIMPFAYGNARLRAKRGRIIKTDEIKSFCNLTYKEIIYRLEKRGFNHLLSLYEHDFQEELVQKNLKKNSLSDLQNMIGYLPNDYKRFFRVLYSRNDFLLIVTVIRNKTSPHSGDSVIDSLCVESLCFNENDTSNMHNLSLDDFLNRLKRTPYYSIIYPYINEIKMGKLYNYESAFAKHYFEKLISASKIDKALRDYTALVIDRHNIFNALCFRKDCSYVKGGTLDEQILKKLCSSENLKDIIKSLEQTRYYDDIKYSKKTIEAYRSLYRFSLRYAHNLNLKAPLSIYPFISHYIEKEIEIKNIRILLKLVHARFNSNEIKEAII
jgi:vacuolar-type H+-ATPase subunit C/Vma6